MDLTTILGRPPRVLIADDDWLMRDLLKTHLTSSGCDVEALPDGQAALERALESPPDLVLADVQMPRLDGISLCKELKRVSETRFIPVIVVTAFDSEEDRIKAINAGADDFIGKPYPAIVLLARVRSLLRIKQLHDQLEERNRLLRRVLDRYVAEDVADIILNDPEYYMRLGGETRKVTVLFADIRGFTRFTEQHEARKVINTLNRVFEPLSQLVYAYRGTFDKYMGDGLMAFYGAPVSEKDDPQRAVDTAIAMQRVFGMLKEDAENDLEELALGIGLHSGEAVVGNIGSSSVMDYTVVGDVVNVAKRLQESASGGEILVSDDTYHLIQGVDAQEMMPVQLPGRQEPITAYLIEAGAY